jgi:hypothetical protein
MKKKRESRKKERPASDRRSVPTEPRKLRHLESLFEMEGLGREYWKDVDPDEYVGKLREGWD